jgi:hypothetical protein
MADEAMQCMSGQTRGHVLLLFSILHCWAGLLKIFDLVLASSRLDSGVMTTG